MESWKNLKTEFYLEKIDDINIENIKNYKSSFRYMFFYWIYDDENKKWWIKMHWLNSSEFLIQIWLVEEWFFDAVIWNHKWIFANEEYIQKYHNIRYKKTKFTNYNREAKNLESLISRCHNIWFDSIVLEIFFWNYIKSKEKLKWDREIKKVFYPQLYLLRDIITRDKDRKNCMIHKYKNWEEDFKKKYWYSIEDRHKMKYKMMLKYIWKENRLFIFSSFYTTLSDSNKLRIEKELENIAKSWEMFDWHKLYYENRYKSYEKWDLIYNLSKISNAKNLNFKERYKFIISEYNKLFNNKLFNNKF